MLVNTVKHQDSRDGLVLKLPIINLSEDCKNFREFLLTAPDLGRGDPRVGEAHEGGPLPGAGPHREQVVERREGETAGQTLHRTTQDSVCRTFFYLFYFWIFYSIKQLLKNI